MLLSNLNLLATAPIGVARLRELILTLAVQGKLVPQDPNDEPASELLKKIRAEKDRLIAEGKIKRDKPLAEIAEDEQPFALPSGWQWVRFDELTHPLKPIAYGVLVPGPDVETGVPFVRIADLSLDSPAAKPEKSISSEVDAQFQRTRLDGGEILMGVVGSIGKLGVAPATWAGANIARAICRIVPADSGLNEFVLFLLQTQFMQESFAGDTRTLAQPTLNIGLIRAALTPVPPPDEQSRIVTRVEELMRLCDALEAKGQLEATQHAQLVSTLLATLTDSETPEALADNWHRIATHFDLLLDRPQAVDALEQTILQLAVRGLLIPQDPQDEPASALLKKIRTEKDKLIAEGKIKRDKLLPPIAEEQQPFALPRGWEWVHVSDTVDMLNGYAFKSEWFKQTGVRLLRNLNVSHGYVDWSQPAAIDSNTAAEYQQFGLRASDIVLSLDRPIISTGLKYAVIRESDLPCLLLQRVARLAPEAKLVSSDFLLLWLQSDLFVGTIDPGRSNGVPHISTKQVAALAFPLPPLAEQSRIVTRVAQLRRLCVDLRQRLSASQSTQAHLAEALVQEVG
jgi:type I restriction enzyme S subunit